ncbi:MAG: HD domain-containing protein [Proteobacteria bacterium]|nr:HD domain-containing protein [Pseudomonadota bacterium]MBU4275196.1 HD domain-containing protein [Pseudomonadota bacterium]MBU4382473.1 HD domain-containing protein [Pseudomonadota bacterium]MBU4604718.1 HD domain-containing protein [Pseudomonadota bacterium]MCG2764990.1 HD domain-containing protein [Desulfarculaceae bacterium]
MQLNPTEQKIYQRVKEVLADEPVASVDHVERMVTWSQKLSQGLEPDPEVLVAGALVHDIGVVLDRPKHFEAGIPLAREVLREAGLSEDKIEPALHVMQAHSRYGGPEPQTLEAKIGQDADALEYLGAIGVVRLVVRGLKDGSFDGKISKFPDFMRSIIAKVDDTFHTEKAEELGRERLEFMRRFNERIEQEIKGEV